MAAKHRQKLTPALAPKLSRRPSKGWLVFGGIVIAAVLGVLLKLGFSPSRLGRSLALPSSAAAAPLLEPEKKVFAEYAGSESCRDCHRKYNRQRAKSKIKAAARWAGRNQGCSVPAHHCPPGDEIAGLQSNAP